MQISHLGQEQHGHDFEPPYAKLQTECHLQPALDRSPQRLLKKKTQSGQQQHKNERTQTDPPPKGHRSFDDISRPNRPPGTQ
jgi:hypothetical protein